MPHGRHQVTTPNQRVDDIFWIASEIDSDEARAAYLQGACGDDAQLRERVDELLHAQTQAESYLEKPAAVIATAAIDTPIEQPGTEIGPYKLREQIGEGGFGVVYVAEQTKPIRRKVALKIIKPGMDSKEIIARFEAERQALALMDHPNIAKVLDAGTTGGVEGQEPRVKSKESLDPQLLTLGPVAQRPYFVMELVRGVPITEFCDKEKLTTEERLRLFTDVCRAVQHAHQKGVIHRDLKPTNVLVTLHDGKPVPKVIDFGVAKALSQQLTEHTLYTAMGQMVGTPMYMSPEQAEMSGLDVDTRSDVYSLGVLLYELLTGSTPFDKQTFKEAGLDGMRRIIRETEPVKPSARISTLEDDHGATISDKRRVDRKRLEQSLRGDLDWVVMKALEKDRNRRYESASAFAADVESFLNNEPVAASPPSAIYRFRKYARRNRVAFSFLATVIGVLALGVVGLSIANARIAAEQANTVAALAESREHYLLAERRAEQAQDAERTADRERHVAEENLDIAMRLAEITANARQGLAEDNDWKERAIQQFNQLAIVTGDRPELYEALGNFHRDLGQYDEAHADYDQMIEVAGDAATADHYRLRAHLFRDAFRDFEAAFRDYDRALALNKTSDQLSRLNSDYVILGERLRSRQQYDDAERAFRVGLETAFRLVQDSPTNDYYWQQYAECAGRLSDLFQETGRSGEVAANLAEVGPFTIPRRHWPESAKAWTDRVQDWTPGSWMAIAHDEDFFDHLQRLMPDDYRPWEARARAFAMLGQFDRAAADFDQAMQRVANKSNMSDWWGSDAELALRIAQWPEVLNRTVTLRPDDERLHVARTRSLASDGKYHEAAIELQRLANRNPRDIWHWYMLATVQIQIGDVTGYADTCEQMLTRWAESSNKAFHLVVIRACNLAPAALRNRREDLQSMLEAIDVSGWPMDWVSQFNIVDGLVAYRDRRLDDARELLNRAEGVTRRRITAEFILSMVEYRSGRHERAIQIYDAAAAVLDEESPQADVDDYREWIHAWLMVEILRREAAELIGATDYLPWASRARAFAAAEQWDRAAADYAKALEVIAADPTEHPFWRDKGPELALEIAQSPNVADLVRELRPDDDRLAMAHARDLAAQGQLESAVEIMRGIAARNEDEYWAWFLMAPLQLRIGDREGYRRSCDELLRCYHTVGGHSRGWEATQTCCLTADATTYRWNEVLQVADEIHS